MMSETEKSKVFYYILLTIGFGLISIPTLIYTRLGDVSFLEIIDKGFVGITLVAIIAITEVSFLKRGLFRVMGWGLLIISIIGFLLPYLGLNLLGELWSYGLVFYWAGFALVINLIIASIKLRSKDVYQYSLFAFLLVRVLYYGPRPAGIGVVDLLLCIVLFILGIFFSIRLIRKK